MNDNFKPHSLTIKELLQGPNNFYSIPRYQRPYKWEDTQVEQLWSDIKDAYTDNQPYYFLGSVITALPSEGEGTYLDVVDGQQRLTTLLILCSVFRDCFPAINGELAHTDQNVIDADALRDTIQSRGRFPRLRLNPRPDHRSSFEGLIVNGDTTQIKRPTKKEMANEDDPSYRYRNTAALFQDLVKKLSEEEAGKLLNYLFNKVHIIRIDCTSKEFAIRLFQVLNDRGLDLTAADLIKSQLIERVEKLYSVADPETYRQKEAQFMSDWQATEQTLKDTDLSQNDLFVLYQYYLLGRNPKRSLSDELREQFKDKDPNLVIADVKRFAECYPRLLALQQRDVYALRYTRWTVYWKTILLTAMMSDYPDFDGIAAALRRFYYVYWVGGFTLSAVKQVTFNMVGWIKEKKPIAFINEQIDQKIGRDKAHESAMNKLTGSIYHESWAKPLLLAFEYATKERGQLGFIDLAKDLHLEHILPQSYATNSSWNHTSQEVAGRYMDTGGNLTLLSGSKNAQASNRSFARKIEVYTGTGLELENGSVTPFFITQQIANDYHANLYNKGWNEEAMVARWDWFCKRANEFLSITIPRGTTVNG